MILKKGNVNFAKSDTSKEQCKRYTIEYGSLEILVENCTLKASLLEVSKKQN